jgi:UDPglucose--hexose-1-phosphate uridylyltransferase
VQRRYDRLFHRLLAYVMAVHDAPAGAEPYDFHLEFYPPNRTADKLKYLAGSEAGAGAYVVDVRAEDAAALLRAL